MFTFRMYRISRALAPYTGTGTDTARRIRFARLMGGTR